MKFRTEFNPDICKVEKLNPNEPVNLTGSCFADNILTKMRAALWDARNPLGTLFNPLSIARLISLAFTPDTERHLEDTCFATAGRWRSWLADTACSADSETVLLDMLCRRLDSFRDSLTAHPTLIVTFGSAWCWFLADKPDCVVANCHKQPAARFTRRLVSVAEITANWSELISRLRTAMPQLRVIFTVSPVRHLNDGLHGNTLSKATLQLAISDLCSRFDCCEYFPAFEIVCDDLRDYRFYAGDMVHPSEQAVGYIWEKFCDTYLDAEGLRFIAEGTRITAARNHRPLLTPLTVNEAEREAARLAALDEAIAKFRGEFPGALG